MGKERMFDENLWGLIPEYESHQLTCILIMILYMITYNLYKKNTGQLCNTLRFVFRRCNQVFNM